MTKKIEITEQQIQQALALLHKLEEAEAEAGSIYDKVGTDAAWRMYESQSSRVVVAMKMLQALGIDYH